MGSTGTKPVAVAVHEDTTFVAWFGEGGRLQLARLNAALEIEDVTDVALTAVYPDDLVLKVGSAGHLYATWFDSVEGQRILACAQISLEQIELVSRWSVDLSDDADYAQAMIRLDVERLELFWSADDRHNSGLYHRALSLAGDEVTPAVQLTETGWRPGVGWGADGSAWLTWLDRNRSAYVGVWRAEFDFDRQALGRPLPVADVRVRRSHQFLGPVVGATGSQLVVAWTVGRRHSSGLGTDLDFPTSEREIAAGLSRNRGAASVITSDKGQYVVVPESSLVLPLTGGQVAEIWQAPRVETVGSRTWVFFSAWVMERSDVRMQILVVPFDQGKAGEPMLVTETRPASVGPDLAVGEDDTLRVAWVEPLGNDMYRVVVASTAPDALDALGGFYLAEWLGDVATFLFENIALLGYVPYVLGWAVLPLGFTVLMTILRPGRMRGWKVILCLVAAILLHFASKDFLAPALLSWEGDWTTMVLIIAPAVLGIGLMWIYWRRVREPLLPIAYALFLAVDAAFTVFVMIPRLMWKI